MSARKKVALGGLAVLVVTLLPCRTAPADGGYFPEKAFEKRPDIPVQRALVRYKDGRETLIVESAVESESPGLGWVIPLPAVPDKMEKADPGLLESLSTVLGAEVVHDLGQHIQAVGFLLLILLLTLALAASGSRVIEILAVILILLLLAGLFLPALGGGRGTSSSVADGVRVALEARVGSYEAKVLEAESASALDEWLAANGFASLGEADLPVIEDYVGKGWCFFTAKLAREKGGVALPHPISLEFEADQAVYPMRLTGLSGGRLQLELTVVAEKEAGLSVVPRLLCDTYFKDHYIRALLWAGRDTGVLVGHPGLDTLFWDGCVVTRFAGEVGPDDMAEDLAFSWRDPTPYRKRVFSRRGAFHTGVVVTFWLSAAAFLAIIIVRWRHIGHGMRDTKAPRMVGMSLLGALLVGLCVFLVIPKRQVQTMRRMGDYRTRSEFMRMLDKGSRAGSFDPRSVASLRAYIREALGGEEYRRAETNPFTGEPVREETSPGNYEIREEPARLQVFVYDRWAAPQAAWASKDEE
jgi:hypothetical protein